MELLPKHAIAVLILWGLASYPSAAQQDVQKQLTGENVSADEGQVAARTLTPDDGLGVIAATLDFSVHPSCQA